MAVKGLVTVIGLGLVAGAAAQSAAAPPAEFAAALSVERVEPNYQLASQWTRAKVDKLVFDTAVTPHWFETGDRFWYSFKTSTGTAYYVVDAARATRGAMFDHVKLAAALTRLTGLPFDGEHLPIEHLKLFNHDATLRFSLSVPRTAVIPGLAAETQDEIEQESSGEGEEGGGGQQGGRGGRAQNGPPKGKRDIYFEMDLATQGVKLLGDYKAPEKEPQWAQISPDGKTVVFSRNYNLYLMDAASYALAVKDPNDANVKEVQLTTDGIKDYAWGRDSMQNNGEDLGTGGRGGTGGAGRGAKKDKSEHPRMPAVRVIWSADSSRFVATRADERKVADLWVIHTLHNPRPTLETYKYAMPGEANVPQYELWMFDVAGHKATKLNTDLFADQHIEVETQPETNREREALPEGQRAASIWLGGANDKLYLARISRDLHKVDYCVANLSDGSVKPIIEERSNVYIMRQPLRLADHGQELLVWSERDGWGHYYLYGADGTLKHQVDQGQFVAGAVEAVDDTTGTLYFDAYGYQAKENSYDSHLYRIALDGTGMKPLDAGDATHRVEASDDGQYFIDTYSRVDTAPESDLLSTSGRLLKLETADLKAAQAAGYQFPTPFTVKADDGITDLYGVMFKPFDFDAHKKYPLIEYVYPGPQTESVESTFNPRSQQMLLAQFGFVVIEVGNRGGSPQRDSWYHTYGYGNLRDYGLADKKRAAEELAQMYPFIDINRVGITGHSGGGFMSTAAILEYPDFFKVAVSESGNHDNNVYNNTWSEEHHGIYEQDGKDGAAKFYFTIDKNSDLAANLKGHLLLSTGDMDNNVHMANTMRLANALIRANKRFDLVVLPGERHGYASDTDYFFWRKADYFCEYLLGSSPHGADMQMLQREVAETGRKGGA